MTAIDFPRSTVTRSQYEALNGKSLAVTYALLEPAGCPTCCGPVKSTGFADWVKTDGLVITLWACINSDCRERRYETSFRLVTEVVADEPAPAPLPTAHFRVIRTRFAGPTNHRGSRIIGDAGDAASRVTLEWDSSLNSDGNHAAAALAVVAKMGWDTTEHTPITGGGYGDSTYWVFLPRQATPPATDALDKLTRAETTFGTFAELVAAPYTPTLASITLADAYDAATGRKAFRRPTYRCQECGGNTTHWPTVTVGRCTPSGHYLSTDRQP
jgi:hypothetical protein